MRSTKKSLGEVYLEQQSENQLRMSNHSKSIWKSSNLFFNCRETLIVKQSNNIVCLFELKYKYHRNFLFSKKKYLSFKLS